MNEIDEKLLQAESAWEFDIIAAEAGWYGPEQWPEAVKKHRAWLKEIRGYGRFEDGDPNGAFVKRERK